MAPISGGGPQQAGAPCQGMGDADGVRGVQGRDGRIQLGGNTVSGCETGEKLDFETVGQED